MEFLYLETLPMMIELECYYSAAKIQSKSTQVNNQPHFNKKTSIETNARPSQKVRLISTIVEILFVFQFQL
nr:MAG TPA: hypothetical protein [Caudoviricetes sp.]